VEAIDVDSGMMGHILRAEVDVQIATARRFPRKLHEFKQAVFDMACLDAATALECLYRLQRGSTTIEGPSVRFAEILASAWGNCRVGARVVDIGEEFITAQGVFHDLQRNVAIAFEVQRRIVDSKGNRYNVDMIGVTGNAACSIALRNAITKGIPKALWAGMFYDTRKAALGDYKTLGERRASALKFLRDYGARDDQIFAYLDVKGAEDIGLEHILTLGTLANALRDNETTLEDAFGDLVEQPTRKAKSEGQGRAAPEPPRATTTPEPEQETQGHAEPPEYDDEPPFNEERERFIARANFPEAKPEPEQRAQPKPAARAPEEKMPVSKVRMLRTKMQLMRVSDEHFAERWGGVPEAMMASQFRTIATWLDNPQA